MKNLNKLAAEYKILKEQAAEIESRLKEINEVFKANGSVDTGDYMVVVSNVEREQLASLNKVAEIFGRQVLEKNSLINTISYQMVKITEKKLKAA